MSPGARTEWDRSADALIGAVGFEAVSLILNLHHDWWNVLALAAAFFCAVLLSLDWTAGRTSVAGQKAVIQLAAQRSSLPEDYAEVKK